ncbi:flagellar hook-associated protein 3 [Cellulomonas sp. WB94]|uniref:flagellar hook-associated protein FlgL n=1 Tax=Cellulomonas sp. WB94 TaxID=2173174 RepID=UPI000D5652A7|nr:flagellar hook-associated protein FlgL [Cellulomonas sp. WB94]PVU83373.1 flagellar hook-associated protein 3 [Cellulomonas sp. WB94]
MISRVTQQTVQRSTLANLQLNLSTMAGMQAKMSSGKKITVPSDDPAAASDVLRLRGELRTQTQYVRNADDGGSWLTTVDTALQSSLSALRRARDLTVQGGNGALGTSSREALATEIDGVRDTLLAQANTTFLGRNVFAGTSDAGTAFTKDAVTGRYAWTGTAAGTVDRRINATTTVRVDADGAVAFGDDAAGDTSVFALLDTISTTLRAGGDATASLGAIDTRMEKMLTQLAGVGARHGQVLTAQTELKSTQLTTKAQLSGIEDIDLAETILQLQAQQTAYQGALGAAAKVLQPTLLDFLR